MAASNGKCHQENTHAGDQHICTLPAGHRAPHGCPCGYRWPKQRTYTPSAASVAWRSSTRLIRDEMPKLGTVHSGSAMRGLTIEEALEDADNEILWLEQELAEHRRYRADLAGPDAVPVTQSDPKET